MIDQWNELDIELKTVLISASTSMIVFFLGWFFKFLYERYSLNYRLNKEYIFEQKKKLKEEISKNKIPLLNSAEELNYRLWNFNENVDQKWHSIQETKWFETNQYYLNSFIYRFLTFNNWVIRTERNTMTIDSTIADKNDILFLKYVKTFRNVFCDILLLEELGYGGRDNTHHFFKNDFEGYCDSIILNGKQIDFEDFKIKLKNGYDNLRKVIEYFSKIEPKDDDKAHNVLRVAHILIIHFLNSFGHKFQVTDKSKFDNLLDSYKTKIKIKKGFREFVKRSKLEKELKRTIQRINPV